MGENAEELRARFDLDTTTWRERHDALNRLLADERMQGRREAIAEMFGDTAGDMSQVSDGYHTFAELYRYRMLYHAAFVNQLERNGFYTVKSLRHSDGELCFGGGWFIVVTHLWDGNDGKPSGQISNHYEAEHWGLFLVPEVEIPPAYDGHTPEQAAERLEHYLTRP